MQKKIAPMSLNGPTSMQITHILSTSELQAFLPSYNTEMQEIFVTTHMETIYIGRKARALEMMINASKSIVSPHDLAENINLVRVGIADLRSFIERRSELRKTLGARTCIDLYDLIRTSEDNFSRTSRTVIQEILNKARAHRLSTFNLSSKLYDTGKQELGRMRIECDDAFAKTVDSSNTCFRSIVQENIRKLESTTSTDMEDIKKMSRESIDSHVTYLERHLEVYSKTISSMIDASKVNWDSEDMKREDLEGQLAKLKAATTKARELYESNRKELTRKRTVTSKCNSRLVDDIIKIQNRYSRLVDKSKMSSEKAHVTFRRILMSDRAELTDMLTQIWNSYKSLDRSSTSVDKHDLGALYEEIAKRESPDSIDDPFQDILDVNACIFDHVSRVYAQLVENCTTRSK